MQKSFDLVVIGSGPGGLRAAIQAAKLGKTVAVVEKSRPGGASVHTGTIPSKSLREAALSCRGRGEFSSAIARMRAIVKAEAKVVADQLERNGVSFFSGAATFLNAREISVADGPTLTGKFFVVAPGTRPIRGDEFPFRRKGVFESDSILSLKTLPPSLLIIGAGVIGCEYASIYARLGSRVTLVDRRKELLRLVDHEIIEALQREFLSSGVELAMGCEFGPILASKGSTKLEVKVNGSKRRFDAILVCMGREPNTAELGLEHAGVKVDERGYITVDRQSFQTSVPNIYAVGDVIGAPGLAASSAEQGRIASCRIFGEPCPEFPLSFPFGIYTIPEISSVGLTEREARDKNIPYVLGRASFKELARGLIVGDQNGFVKILVNPENRRVLGVHAIGMSASELVHIGQAVLALKAPVDFFVDNVFNYPTFGEAYKVAALHAVNQLKV